MLEDLLVAVESETQVVDIGRVSGFMQKVKSTRAHRDYFSELTPCNAICRFVTVLSSLVAPRSRRMISAVKDPVFHA